MYFDRFDICAAWNLYLQHTHDGQFSDKYRRLSKLLTYFRPSPSEEDPEGLNDNARAIYDRLMSAEGLI